MNSRDDSNGLSSTEGGEASGTSDIPGYVWDPQKKRHFRILSDEQGRMISGSVTKSKLQSQKLEHERLQLREGEGGPGKCMTGSKRGGNLVRNLGNLQLGSCPAQDFKARLINRRVSNLKKSASSIVKILNGEEEVGEGEELDSCQFLTASSDGRNVLGAWKLLGRPWSRIGCLDARLSPKKTSETSLGLEFRPTGTCTYALDPYIIDLCKAPVDSSVTCVLYATTPLLPNLGGHVYLEPVPEMSCIDDTDFLASPVYNVHVRMERSVCSCAWNSHKMRVGVGMEAWGMILDVVAERRFKLNSRGKNVLAQEFSKDGNSLFMGLRSGDIMCSDLRLPSRRIVSSLEESSTHWIKLLEDSNFLLGANLHGEIKLWDLRMSKHVFDFLGHRNSHTKVSCVVDESESLIFAAGEDGTTRGWSLVSGDLLCAVPSPYRVTERSTVPRICYSNNWAGLSGTGALILGLRDELHVHELQM